MRISVIITTYNQPEWLEKVLWGYAAQTLPDFEVVVADDGSGADTRDAIGRVRPELPALRHVWHADEGFRKCEILNKAILAAEGDYLVFTDGDCVPHRDLLAVHRRLAEPGRFLSGGYLKLPMEVSRLVGRGDVMDGSVLRLSWLRAQGVPFSIRLARLAAGPAAARLLDLLTTTRSTFNGHNASLWRSDAMTVNGFDERMGWGGLDRDFGARLRNLGIRGKQIRYRAHMVHLDHPRSYKSSEIVAANRRIRAETARSGRIRAVVGLDRHASRRPG